MSKILIELYVPAITSTYDIYVPANAHVATLLPLFDSAVKNLSHGLYASSNAVLCCGDTGIIFSSRMTVKDMNLKNGSRLMLL